MPLSPEEDQRIARLGVDESARMKIREVLAGMAPRERQHWLDQLEEAAGSGAAPARHSPFAHRSPSSCDRCRRTLSGRYYSLKKPGGGTAELCLPCARQVRLRLRMLAARPNRPARELALSAIHDLEEAAALDPGSDPVRANLKNIRALLAATGGRPLAYALVWAPLWAVSRTFGGIGNAVLVAVLLAVAWGVYRNPALWLGQGAGAAHGWTWALAGAGALFWLVGLLRRLRRRRW